MTHDHISGAEAFEAGMCITSCPYSFRSDEGRKWIVEWNKAARAHKKRFAA